MLRAADPRSEARANQAKSNQIKVGKDAEHSTPDFQAALLAL